GPDNDKRLTQARDRALEQVQLRRGGPWGFDPRAALVHQGRLQGLSGRPPPELARRPLPDRVPDPEDHRGSSDRQGRCGLSDVRYEPGLARESKADSPWRPPLWRIIAF